MGDGDVVPVSRLVIRIGDRDHDLENPLEYRCGVAESPQFDLGPCTLCFVDREVSDVAEPLFGLRSSCLCNSCLPKRGYYADDDGQYDEARTGNGGLIALLRFVIWL